MAEREPPPSPASTPAAGLRREEGLKRKWVSDADVDEESKPPKLASWNRNRGLTLVDDEPTWGKPQREFSPPSWGSGEEDFWQGARHVSVAAWGSGEEDFWQGARHVSVAAWGSGEEDVGPPRKVARQDDSVTTHDLEEPEDMFGPHDSSLAKEGPQTSEEDMCKTNESYKSKEIHIDRLVQKGEAEASLKEIEAEKNNRFAITWDFPDYDPLRKNRIQWENPMSHLVKQNDPESIREYIGHDPEPTHSWLKHGVDPPNPIGMESVSHWDGEDHSYGAHIKSVFESRSEREGKVWQCSCMTPNFPRRKLVFSLPKFQCDCGQKFLEKHDLDFCLADIRANWELVVSRIFDQDGPYCMENSCCQAMFMSYTLECINKDTEVRKHMMNMDPGMITTAYLHKYPKMGLGVKSSIDISSVHKFIKMALMLKNKGIELKDKSFWRIGDVSFINKNDHKTICEELANGVPLLAVITPGVKFHDLKYCQVYRPPLLEDVHECNRFHKEQKHNTVHEAHMVVLVGPCFKADRGRAYHFVNSHADWCRRKVIDDAHELADGIKKPVEYGVGIIEEEGLVYSVIKLWKFGETAGPDSVTLEDEDDDEENKYENKPSNRQKFMGEYQA